MLFGKYINKYYKKYWYYFLIGVVFLIVVDVAQNYIPKFLGQVVNSNNELIADMDELKKVIFGVMICAGVMFVGRCIWRLSIFRASSNIKAGVRYDMFVKAERMSRDYYHETKVGNVLNWFTSDVDEIGEFFGWGTVMFVDAFFMTIITLISMIRVSIWMTLIAAIPLILIAVWGGIVEKHFTLRWEARQEATDKLYDFCQENFSGIRVIKAFVKETQEIHHFAKLAKNSQEKNVKFARMSVLFDVVIGIILAVEMAFVLGFGGWFVYLAATKEPITIGNTVIDINIGQLMEFVGYIDLLIWPMMACGQIVSMRSRAKGSLKRITKFLDAEEDIKSPTNAVILNNVKGDIKFDHFSFTYPNDKEPRLKDINIEIKPGESIGVIGKIGSGKTTFANILMRLYNFDRGVTIDGVDLMDCDIPSLREQIAYSPQDNFLFSDKIENNISFSSETLNRDMVIEAAQFSSVHDDIEGFIDKYETVSGERGVTLSGGQKQRISIARAFYKKAPVLILDDSVSAVDVKTEESILNAIEEKRKGMTTIVIASRVSTVTRLDKILVLEKGEVAGFDTHENLMKNCEIYQHMVYLQELEKEVEGGE